MGDPRMQALRRKHNVEIGRLYEEFRATHEFDEIDADTWTDDEKAEWKAIAVPVVARQAGERRALALSLGLKVVD